MDREPGETGFSQRGACDAIFETLRAAWRTPWQRTPGGSSPPTCRRCSPTPTAASAARRSSIPSPANPIVQVPPLAEDKLYPKEQALADRVKEGGEVLVCHPRLVQTGLDLVDFPTIVWFETDYSVYTMRQASRRS